MTQPQPSTTEDLSPLVAAAPALAALYIRALDRVRSSLAEFITKQFRHSGQWREEDAVRFARAVVPIVAGAQASVSALTSAYLSNVAKELTGTLPPPAAVPSSEVTGSAVRLGVDPKVVYRRPYTQVWTDLAAGTPLDQAVDNGERRAMSIATTDIQLAKTHTAKKALAKDKRVTWYRRVPRGTYTCALCLIVSTRRYHKKQLMPIHPGCDCGIEQVFGARDPGPVLDEDFLEAVHDAIERDLGREYVSRSGTLRSTRARELYYRDIVIVHEHGELGPVLGVRGQKFTGPEEIRRFTTHDRINLRG